MKNNWNVFLRGVIITITNLMIRVILKETNVKKCGVVNGLPKLTEAYSFTCHTKLEYMNQREGNS